MKKFKEIYELNKEANNLFHYNLKNLKKDSYEYRYLKKRNLTNEIIEKFRIGYSNGDGIINFLTSKNYKESLMVKSGLVYLDEDVKINEYFIKRIMFPIFDENDNIIGFSGRVIDNKNSTKYLNTKETIVFKKGNVLYNLNNAKSSISLKNQVILVEGFMDVVSFSKIGINNVVAIMGTTLTINQQKLLSNLTKNYIIAFDGDKAGKIATIKACKVLLNNSKNNVKILELNNNIDIDELIKNKSKEFVINKIKSSIDSLEYFWKNLPSEGEINDNLTYEIKIFLKYLSKKKW